MNQATIKITPAMRQWCKRIASGHTTLRKTGVMNYSASGLLGHSKPTYVIVNKLEDAGLITWSVQNPDSDRCDRVAILTEAGKAAAK